VEAVWRWGVLSGLAIVVVDLAAALLSSGQPDTSQQLVAAQTIDLLANLSIYSFCGFRVGNLTRVVRSAAEAGVTAGILVGIAAIVAGQVIAPPVSGDLLSPIAVLAENIAMGGLLAAASGFLGMRAPEPKR